MSETAKEQYDECMRPGEELSAIERLRFFCSCAMNQQDWLDVGTFFTDVETELEQARAALKQTINDLLDIRTDADLLTPDNLRDQLTQIIDAMLAKERKK